MNVLWNYLVNHSVFDMTKEKADKVEKKIILRFLNETIAQREQDKEKQCSCNMGDSQCYYCDKLDGITELLNELEERE